jgi:hypothetical protein
MCGNVVHSLARILNVHRINALAGIMNGFDPKNSAPQIRRLGQEI